MNSLSLESVTWQNGLYQPAPWKVHEIQPVSLQRLPFTLLVKPFY